MYLRSFVLTQLFQIRRTEWIPRRDRPFLTDLDESEDDDEDCQIVGEEFDASLVSGVDV